MDNILKIDIFKEVVIPIMSNYLKNFDFIFIECIDENIIEEKGVTISYKNECRGISIYYCPHNDNEQFEFTLVHINKLPNSTALISKLLQKKGINYERNFYKEEIDFRDMVVAYCEYLIFLFEKYLKTIISGEEWIDFPVDWYGYK
ncbi:MAG: hypothetical protein LBL24_09545 [Bacteroidales bacterium]|jgi:hypothetical protein|nr:hypothetical protein [Bacteroidales bacterium]